MQPYCEPKFANKMKVKKLFNRGEEDTKSANHSFNDYFAIHRTSLLTYKRLLPLYI